MTFGATRIPPLDGFTQLVQAHVIEQYDVGSFRERHLELFQGIDLDFHRQLGWIVLAGHLNRLPDRLRSTAQGR